MKIRTRIRLWYLCKRLELLCEALREPSLRQDILSLGLVDGAIEHITIAVDRLAELQQ